MSQVTGDFSQGNIRSIILKLGIPIVAAEFVHIFYNLVDRMYIGHMPGTGTAALTGVGIVFPLITFINSFAELFGVGGAPLSAIARGEKDNEKAERIMETSFSALVLIGTLLTLVLLCFAPLLVRLMGGEKEAGVHALAYFRVYALGTVPVLLCLGMNPFINSLGFSRTGMLTVVIGAVLNTILDPILIYAFHLGVTGAAIATVISQTISAGWVILFLTSSRPPLKIRRLHISLSCLKPIMKLGITGFTFKTTTSITQAVVNLTLRKWGGVLSMFFVSAASIINSLREVINLPVLGMTQGAEAVMSFNYGAKKYDRVLDTIRFIFSLSLSVNTAIWGLLMIFPQIFISIFTSDGQLIGISVKCLRLFFGIYPFMAMQMTGQHTFVALNHPQKALLFSMFRKVILVVPLTVFLPYTGLGVYGVFAAEMLSQLIGASACFATMILTVARGLKRSQTSNCP